MKSTLSLITVSLTAVFIIPGICNAATKPLLNAFTGKKNNHSQSQNSPVKQIDKPVKNVNFGNYKTLNAYSFKDFYNSGMKIGGM